MTMKSAVAARIWAQDLKAFCVAAMLKSGLSQEDADLTAEVLVTTDTWGTFTHGTRQLRGLLVELVERPGPKKAGKRRK